MVAKAQALISKVELMQRTETTKLSSLLLEHPYPRVESEEGKHIGGSSGPFG